MSRPLRNGQFPLQAFIIPAIGLLLILAGGCDLHRDPKLTVSYQTCRKCRSTRINGPEGLKVGKDYRSPSYKSCCHDWKDGISSAHPTLVKDGKVILLRKGETFGAFALRNQKRSPEETEYEWFLRSDGQATFDEATGNVKSGTEKGREISFGPFDVAWSGSSENQGWIYYGNFPGDTPSPGDTYICVTEETSLKGINGLDEKWVYKASPVDAGIRGSERKR